MDLQIPHQFLQATGDNFALEKHLYASSWQTVAGTDEAGRGPLAGPVVAAAVILPRRGETSLWVDSKKLSHKKLLLLRNILIESDAIIGVGVCSVIEIDQLNILQASLLAMERAVLNLSIPPDCLLVDGKFPTHMQLPQLPLIKGESRSASIAAASIIAKTHRDQLLCELHEKYPQYNFAQHKGYPTREHRNAIKKYGICPAHRRTFKGVKEYVDAAPAPR
jgi:ribonuclease HII